MLAASLTFEQLIAAVVFVVVMSFSVGGVCGFIIAWHIFKRPL